MKKVLLPLLLIFCFSLVGFSQTKDLLTPADYISIYIKPKSPQTDTLTFSAQQVERQSNILYLKIVHHNALSTHLYAVDLKTKNYEIIDSSQYYLDLELFSVDSTVYYLKQENGQVKINRINSPSNIKQLKLQMPLGVSYDSQLIPGTVKTVYFTGRKDVTKEYLFSYDLEKEELTTVTSNADYWQGQILTFGDSVAFNLYNNQNWRLGYGNSGFIKLDNKPYWTYFKGSIISVDPKSKMVFGLDKNASITDTLLNYNGSLYFQGFENLGKRCYVKFMDSITNKQLIYQLLSKQKVIKKAFEIDASYAEQSRIVPLQKGHTAIVKTKNWRSDSITVYNDENSRIVSHHLDSIHIDYYLVYGSNRPTFKLKEINNEIYFNAFLQRSNQGYIFKLNSGGDKLSQVSPKISLEHFNSKSPFHEFGGNIYILKEDTQSLLINNLTDEFITLNFKYFIDEDGDSIWDVNEYSLKNFALNVGANRYYISGVTSRKFLIDTYTVEAIIPKMWNLIGESKIHIDPFETDKKEFDVFFGIQPKGEKLIVDGIVGGKRTRCGFKTWMRPKIKNIGNTPFNGSITFYVDSLASIDSFSREPDSTFNGGYVWYFENIEPTDYRWVKVYLKMPGVQHMGKMMNFTGDFAAFKENKDKVYSSDNRARRLTCGYDPNDKTVWPQRTDHNDHTLFDETMTFRIRFQNTGNDTAFNIRILDTLSEHLNLKTFKILDYSHAMTTKMSDNGIVEFQFDNILLPDSNVNEPESHGFITYSIRADSNLAEQTEINNTAYIYFDFNPPIVTNTTRNVMVSEIVGINEYDSKASNSLLLYPNPARQFLQFKSVNEIDIIKIYNTSGQLVLTEKVNFKKQVLDISELNKGMFIIKAIGKDSAQQAVFIKEY